MDGPKVVFTIKISEGHYITVERDFAWLDFDYVRNAFNAILDIQDLRYPRYPTENCPHVGKEGDAKPCYWCEQKSKPAAPVKGEAR